MKRLLCVLLALLCLSGCARTATEETMRAMAVRLPGGGLLLVRMDGAPEPFSAKLPEQIADADGSVIAPDALHSGDVVELTGDGVLAESWPAQYPGVTSVRVVSRGDEDDLAPYREALAGLLPEETQDEPPELTLQWEGGSAQASMGNYHWQRDNGDGTTTAAIACGPHVLMWCPIAQIGGVGGGVAGLRGARARNGDGGALAGRALPRGGRARHRRTRRGHAGCRRQAVHRCGAGVCLPAEGFLGRQRCGIRLRYAEYREIEKRHAMRAFQLIQKVILCYWGWG